MLLSLSQRPTPYSKAQRVMEKLVHLVNWLSNFIILDVCNKKQSGIGNKTSSNKPYLFQHIVFYIHVLILLCSKYSQRYLQ